MNFQIKNHITGAVIFERELSSEVAGKEYRFQLGFAIQKAIKARANLAGAYLAGANLAGANLAGACLTDAYLAGANLAGANLAGANLAGACLTDAYLAGANLAGANLAGAKWKNGITIQRRPIQVFGLDYPITILDQHMQIGCEIHKLSEWRDFGDRRIVGMDGARAAKFWKRNKEFLLALAASEGRGVEAVETESSEKCAS